MEILVDEEGVARLPRIVSATEPAFGYAAVQAVSTWRFEAPKVGGKPVVAHVKVPVKFNLKSAEKASAAAFAQPGSSPATEPPASPAPPSGKN